MAAKPKSKAKVIRSHGAVRIDGVKGFSFAQRTSSVHAAMETVMRTVGEDVSYEDLVGASGLAFRTQMHQSWCPSSPHSFCGFQCVTGSVALLPWRVKAYEVKADDAAGVKKARAAVVASIDAGVPCAYGSEEDGVIVGYQRSGAEWLCVHPLSGRGKQFVETKWPWGIGVYTGRKPKAPDRRAIALDALTQAVKMAHTKNVEKYDCGFHAWGQWIKRLRDEKWIADGLAKKWPVQLGKAWAYDCLVRYRQCAAKYLRGVAPLFEKPAAAQLRNAAEFYERMVAEHLNPKGACTTEIAPYSGGPSKGIKWDKASRTAQADRLAAALALERKAIGEIGKALDWIETVPGQVRPAKLEKLALTNVKVPEDAWAAHVPMAVVQAMRHAGARTDYAEVAAANGWAFSFSYDYRNWHCAALPLSQFTFLAKDLGLQVQSVRLAKKDAAWTFIRKHVDAGTPMICELGDGGLVYGYRTKSNKRQFWFDGCPPFGWWDLSRCNPYVSCAVLVKKARARPATEIIRKALARAVDNAVPHEVKGKPRGLAALEAYAADVADPAKSFENIGEWFCWAAFERLAARKCAAIWLRRSADVLGGSARKPMLAAADLYAQAAAAYSEYDREVHRSDLEALPWKQRFETPKRIAALIAPLRKGIAAETQAVEQLEKALAAAGRDAGS